MGFSSLNPPFTIRCVETEEEEGTIYDASLKGFFKTIMNISGTDTDRLPTSSTCFNLLKLPNYAKKSTLKDKLKYAIRSNAGFELS
jgi:ubiquitin-protein ligase E3 B